MRKFLSYAFVFLVGLSFTGIYIYQKEFKELSEEEYSIWANSFRPELFIQSSNLPLSKAEQNYYETVKLDLKKYKHELGLSSGVWPRVYVDDNCGLEKFDEATNIIARTGVVAFELFTEEGWQKFDFICPCSHVSKSLIILKGNKYIFTGKEMGFEDFKKKLFDKKLMEEGEFFLEVTTHYQLSVKDLRSFMSLAKEAGWKDFRFGTFALGRYGEESFNDSINEELKTVRDFPTLER